MRRATGAEVPSSGGCFNSQETARVSTALSSSAILDYRDPAFVVGDDRSSRQRCSAILFEILDHTDVRVELALNDKALIIQTDPLSANRITLVAADRH